MHNASATFSHQDWWAKPQALLLLIFCKWSLFFKEKKLKQFLIIMPLLESHNIKCFWAITAVLNVNIENTDYTSTFLSHPMQLCIKAEDYVIEDWSQQRSAGSVGPTRLLFLERFCPKGALSTDPKGLAFFFKQTNTIAFPKRDPFKSTNLCWL